MTTTSTDTATTATYVPQVGDYVRKGNGTTVYRVWGTGSTEAAVVKATTKTNPTRGCWYPHSLFTQVERPADAADLTPVARAAKVVPTDAEKAAAKLVADARWKAQMMASKMERLAFLTEARSRVEDTGRADLEARIQAVAAEMLAL